MNHSTTFIFLVFFGVGIAGLALVGLILSQGFKKLQNLAQSEEFRKTLPQNTGESAKSYPLVIPTPASGKTLGCSVILLFVMIAGIAIGMFVQQLEISKAQQLQNQGVVVAATVSDKDVDRDSDDGDTYSIRYTFRAVGGDGAVGDYGRWESVTESFYDRTEVGTTVEVVYVSDAPHISLLRDFYTPGKVDYWGAVIGAGVAILCLALGAGQLNRHRYARRLDAEGVQTVTQIVDHYSHADSDGTSYYIIYDLPGMGRVRQLASRNVQNRYPVGSTVRLLYLPDNPAIFRVEEESF